MSHESEQSVVHQLKRGILYALDYTRISLIQASIRAYNRKNAVFIWIPKTAGTSIFSMLSAPKLKSLHAAKFRFANKGIATFGHMDYRKLIDERIVTQTFDQSAFKFTFIRNPYERAVSLYFYMRSKSRIKNEDDSFLGFCRSLERTGFESIGLYNYKGNSQCNPQIKWMENLKIDYVGKMESLETDMEIIFQHLGIANQPIPHKNKSTREFFQSYYCQESKELVDHLYNEDFSQLGYETYSLSDLTQQTLGKYTNGT